MADPDLEPLQTSETGVLPWQDGLYARLSARVGEALFPHASLLTGPGGTGKTGLAMTLAALLVCERPTETGERRLPCGECKQCRLVTGEGHPDARYLHPTDQSRVIRIHQIRALGAFSSESPQVARRKVVVISRADLLHLNAANALLKTLEEPPADTFLILLHRSGQPVLPTIRSRCQSLRVQSPEHGVGLAWLSEHCPEAGDTERQAALQWSGGAPLEARRLLQSGRIDQRRECLRAMQQYLKGACSTATAVQPFLALPFAEALDLLQDWAHDLGRASADPDSVRDGEAAAMLRFLASRRHPVDLHRVYDEARDARRGMEYNVNPEIELAALLGTWRWLMKRPHGVAKRG